MFSYNLFVRKIYKQNSQIKNQSCKKTEKMNPHGSEKGQSLYSYSQGGSGLNINENDSLVGMSEKLKDKFDVFIKSREK